ncbi:MAG: isocitrate dehydrogenase [Candidatus Midichloriaceae bacterium]|jgi:isocitrate dehydrogenase
MKQDTITVAYGDGIGPEIMEATLKILKNAEIGLKIESIDIGQKVFEKGITSGIVNDSWEIITRNKILLKAPITTPLGGGYKSLNVTFRRTLELFANIRPAVSYYPFVGKDSNMDVVVVRENEEDLYSGIEYKITPNANLGMKMVSVMGCERIVRYAFEYAKNNNRKKVTCITKSNIMKITDGCFKHIFEIISKEYPDIIADHMIVDIAAAKLATQPSNFDVIVTLNLYGDILSDIASEVSGSVGLSGSANIGKDYAMFEAVHGSAPDIAGKNIANPSGLLSSAVMMLSHLGHNNKAKIIHEAWLKTIEDGYHTADIYNKNKSTKLLSTTEFTDVIIKNLGMKPQTLKTNVELKQSKQIVIKENITFTPKKEIFGIDVFINECFSEELVQKLQNIDENLKLHMVSCRGLIVWPYTISNTKADFYRFRFVKNSKSQKVSQTNLVNLISKIDKLNINILLTVNLFSYDGEIGFSLAQGE